MRKLQIVSAFLALSLFFLGVQFILFKYMARDGKVSSYENERKRRNMVYTNFENIKHFSRLCLTHGLPVFLIDPYILSRVMSNVTGQNSCKYMCNNEPVTSFGILSQLWKQTEEIQDNFRRNGFSLVFYMETDPQATHFVNATNTYVITHYFFQRKMHTIHLVFFYERTKSGIWWHGSMDEKHSTIKGDTESVHVNKSQLSFGQHQGAFDRMETIKVRVDGINIRAPRYPNPFLQAIPSSKLVECNYTRANLFYSKFGRETDSKAITFCQNAKDLLAQAKKTLDELGIQFWLSSGTCLGWFRQCDIIPYSQDVDLGIWIKDYDVRLIPAMQMSGMPLKHLFGKESDSFELSFHGGPIKLDIFFFYEEKDHMWNGGTQAKTAKKFKYIFPKFTLCWTEFLDLKVRVPCQTTSYIEANYGKNWFEPVRNWDWKKSPSNIHENGEWPAGERTSVIQHF